MERYKISILLLTYVILGVSMDSNVTDVHADDLTSLAEELLEKLCPLVDICDANATTAELSPNGKLDRNRISCCKGCSCHADCKERQNCCYPDEKGTGPRREQSTPKYECLDSLIVHPDVYVPPAEKRSFLTVVNTPQGGCVVDEPLKILPGISVQPSCKETSYFPVYSELNDKIYKNIQCAHCHGVKDPRLFIPLLSCINGRRSETPLSEQFYYFESGKLSKKCRIIFKYDKQELLAPKRCYSNATDTCQSDALHLPPVRNLPDFNFGAIRKLCESSVYAPYADKNNIYKNVFCAMCDQSSIFERDLTCEPDTTKTFEAGSFTHLIDQKVLFGQNDRTAKYDYPVACLFNKEEQKDSKPLDRCPMWNISDEKRFQSKACGVFYKRSKSRASLFKSHKSMQLLVEFKDLDRRISRKSKQPPYFADVFVSDIKLIKKTKKGVAVLLTKVQEVENTPPTSVFFGSDELLWLYWSDKKQVVLVLEKTGHGWAYQLRQYK